MGVCKSNMRVDESTQWTGRAHRGCRHRELTLETLHYTIWFPPLVLWFLQFFVPFTSWSVSVILLKIASLKYSLGSSRNKFSIFFSLDRMVLIYIHLYSKNGKLCCRITYICVNLFLFWFYYTSFWYSKILRVQQIFKKLSTQISKDRKIKIPLKKSNIFKTKTYKIKFLMK